MGREKQRSGGELVQGTLDMLILKALTRGPMHGYGIAEPIQQASDDVLRVEEGSLYPALHRLELDGMIDSEWGTPPTIAGRSSTGLRRPGVNDWSRKQITGARWHRPSPASWRWYEVVLQTSAETPGNSIRISKTNSGFIWK